MLLFESNDPEQVNFVKDAYKKIKQIQDLRFTPILLVQTKMDLTQNMESSSRGQQLKLDLKVSAYQEISSKTGEISDCIE